MKNERLPWVGSSVFLGGGVGAGVVGESIWGAPVRNGHLHVFGVDGRSMVTEAAPHSTKYKSGHRKFNQQRRGLKLCVPLAAKGF